MRSMTRRQNKERLPPQTIMERLPRQPESRAVDEEQHESFHKDPSREVHGNDFAPQQPIQQKTIEKPDAEPIRSDDFELTIQKEIKTFAQDSPKSNDPSLWEKRDESFKAGTQVVSPPKLVHQDKIETFEFQLQGKPKEVPARDLVQMEVQANDLEHLEKPAISIVSNLTEPVQTHSDIPRDTRTKLDSVTDALQISQKKTPLNEPVTPRPRTNNASSRNGKNRVTNAPPIRPLVTVQPAITVKRPVAVNAGSNRDASETTVQISIGRIEVRANVSQQKPTARADMPRRTGPSLEHYLQAGSAGRSS